MLSRAGRPPGQVEDVPAQGGLRVDYDDRDGVQPQCAPIVTRPGSFMLANAGASRLWDAGGSGCADVQSHAPHAGWLVSMLRSLERIWNVLAHV
jgi:hypothetical protein